LSLVGQSRVFGNDSLRYISGFFIAFDKKVQKVETLIRNPMKKTALRLTEAVFILYIAWEGNETHTRPQI